jgi:hypothetical protein
MHDRGVARRVVHRAWAPTIESVYGRWLVARTLALCMYGLSVRSAAANRGTTSTVGQRFHIPSRGAELG